MKRGVSSADLFETGHYGCKSIAKFNVSALLRQYFNIAFLMARPQDLPGAVEQLKLGVILAFCTHVAAALTTTDLVTAMVSAGFGLLLWAAILWLGLVLTNRRARFVQAFGGLAGASAFINMAALPIYWSSSPQEPATNAVVLAAFVLLVWTLSLIAHIVRHTFECAMVVSIIVAILASLLSYNLQDVVLQAFAGG